MRLSRRNVLLGHLCVVALLACAGTASAAPAPRLHWKRCGHAGAVCATLPAPRDYDEPHGKRTRIALAMSRATDPRHRVGVLVFNLGGPGAPAVDMVKEAGSRLDPAVSRRFDIVAMDRRGVGHSTPLACRIDPATQGPYAKPLPTPASVRGTELAASVRFFGDRCGRRNRAILAHASTADVARDIDLLRRSLHERRINYYGLSYGGTLGATLLSMFPHAVRAAVLDAAVEPDVYLNHPLRWRIEQAAAAERTLGRFFAACAADQRACAGFGGSDPRSAFAALVRRADETPIDAGGYAADPTPVTGDDLRLAAFNAMYAKAQWGALAQALAAAAAGNGAAIRRIVDEEFYGNRAGSADATHGAPLEAINKFYARHDTGSFLRYGRRCAERFEFFAFWCGYIDLYFAAFPVHAQDVYRGPFTVSRDATPPLLLGTTYDPVAPYEEIVRLTRRLGHARLLTMDGDQHGAYGSGSRCVDHRVVRYLEKLVLPRKGTRCRQTTPFG